MSVNPDLKGGRRVFVETWGCQMNVLDGRRFAGLLARDGYEKQLAQRTLTKLYNERPAWLAQAHEALDAAVAAAYGWPDYTPQMPDEEILRRLLALNRERATT